MRLRVSTNALKSVDHNGGLDALSLKAKADVLSPRALDLKRAIQKKVGKPVFVEEGELKPSFSRGIRILNGWVERPGRFCMAEPAQQKVVKQPHAP